jgi:hypothetical protein
MVWLEEGNAATSASAAGGKSADQRFHCGAGDQMMPGRTKINSPTARRNHLG